MFSKLYFEISPHQRIALGKQKVGKHFRYFKLALK